MRILRHKYQLAQHWLDEIHLKSILTTHYKNYSSDAWREIHLLHNNFPQNNRHSNLNFKSQTANVKSVFLLNLLVKTS